MGGFLKIINKEGLMQYDEIKTNAKVKSLVSFASIPEGSTGTVTELYSLGTGKIRGFTVAWHGPGIEGIKDGFSELELDTLEFLK